VEVYEIQEGHLDQDYLDTWAARLGLVDLMDEVRRRVARPPDDPAPPAPVRY
jgi:hypothetical protein